MVEVERASAALDTPAARLIERDGERTLLLGEVEELLASGAVVVDACRRVVWAGREAVSLTTRPVLFALVRALAEAWPGDLGRDALLARAFRARFADDSHRARLRVEIGRLRKELQGIADVKATRHGFGLAPRSAGKIVVLAPLVEDDLATVLALLADGEAWSSSALALALSVSPRTVLRSLHRLEEAGKVRSTGLGRACRWMTPPLPGFPTSLLLPAPLPGG